MHAADFSVIARHLYKMGVDEILRRYVPDFERDSNFTKAHRGAAKDRGPGRT